MLGVCQATLRLWEKKDLVHPVRVGKNRFYSECNIERLQKIKELLREEHINIAGVKNILNRSLCWEIKKCATQEKEACPVYKKFNGG